MSQLQPVPGPSQDAFNSVVDQIATLEDSLTGAKHYANKSLNDLQTTFIGYGYNVTDAPDGAWGFIINIASMVDGAKTVNQQWCKNDSTTWHCRNCRNGSWSAWS